MMNSAEGILYHLRKSDLLLEDDCNAITKYADAFRGLMNDGNAVGIGR